jgi:hypothetical protein
MSQRSTRRRRFGAIAGAIALLATAACGSSGDDSTADNGSGDASSNEVGADESNTDEGTDDLGDGMADALGAGGGGSLVFDGEEIVIDSAICAGDSENFEVGTVSDSGYRVLISSSSTGTPSSQIVDPDFAVWFPVGQDAAITIDGGTYTSQPTPYFSNDKDGEVEVSYVVNCP